MSLDREKADVILLDLMLAATGQRAPLGGFDVYLDRLTECVTPDSRLERIKALCDELDRAHAMRAEHPSTDIVARLRAILSEPARA